MGPTCHGAATQHEVGTRPRQEQGRLCLPALLSLGSSTQKPLAPGSPCPTALTNALNVVATAPAVPPAAFTPHNNQVSWLIAAAGRSQYSERLLHWAFPPGNQAVPTRPSTSGPLSGCHFCQGSQHDPWEAGAQPYVQGSTHVAATKAGIHSKPHPGWKYMASIPTLPDDLCGEPWLHLGPASSLSLAAKEAGRSEAGAGVDKGIFWVELCHSIAA